MNFLEAVKMVEDGKDVCYDGIACDTQNPKLFLRDLGIYFDIGKGKRVPVGCINGNYKIVNKKTLSDKIRQERLYVDDVKAANKEFKDVCEDMINSINPNSIKTDLTPIAKEIFGDDLI